jgi:tetratricopeptide (TPR) repeat protein
MLNFTRSRGICIATYPLLIVAFVLLTACPCRADPDTAKQFLKLGRRAVVKREYDQALNRFKKALEEDADLIEAHYWLAYVLDKKADNAGAIEGYRRFLSLFENKGGKAGATRDLCRLAEKTSKRLDKIAKAEKAFTKLENGFLKGLMKFARETFLRDPSATRRALEILLKIRPDYRGAAGLYRKLGGRPKGSTKAGAGRFPAPDAFKKVKSWKDFIAGKALGGESGDWTYKNRELCLDLRQGSVTLTNKTLYSGTNFAYEIEARVEEEYDRGWLVGMVFGSESGSFVCVFFQKTAVILHQVRSASDRMDLKRFLMPPLPPKSWHRLSVLVRGGVMEVWFDGKKVIEFTHPDRTDFDGQVGLFQQRSRTRYRRIRLGKMD